MLENLCHSRLSLWTGEDLENLSETFVHKTGVHSAAVSGSLPFRVACPDTDTLSERQNS